MAEYMYRFRSQRHLFDEHEGKKGFDELEKQEIYFATRDEVNDPADGLKDIFWKGDRIVWKNLLKHYLLCLEHACFLFILAGKDTPPAEIAVFKTFKDLPTSMYVDLYESICRQFFGHDDINKVTDHLSSVNRPIRRNELLFYLYNLHFYSLNTIIREYEKRGLVPKHSIDHPLASSAKLAINFENIKELERISLNEGKDIEVLYEISNHVRMQIALIEKINTQNREIAQENWRYLISEFPGRYLNKLEDLLYRPSYVAAFSSICDDSAMWGYYGDGHRGFCLKFKTNAQQGIPAIRLRTITGYRGGVGEAIPMHTDIYHRLERIVYADKLPDIDFYRSLGGVPRFALEQQWYRDEDGNKSECGEHIYKNEEEWREKYWKVYSSITNTKLRPWERENEYRISIGGTTLIDYTDKEKRKLKYRFEDLDGIIFGIKTPDADKIRTIKIIEEKCRKESRKDFGFFQTYYSPQNGKIQVANLGLFKFQ